MNKVSEWTILKVWDQTDVAALTKKDPNLSCSGVQGKDRVPERDREEERERERDQEVERDQSMWEPGHLKTNWEIFGGPGLKWEVA